ncbi:MAG TPA: hypothetical protein VED02_02995, partial [Methyloceanibacter sp.]|nr:hypothetical protein [Methyloceanibacter sp.]
VSQMRYLWFDQRLQLTETGSWLCIGAPSLKSKSVQACLVSACGAPRVAIASLITETKTTRAVHPHQSISRAKLSFVATGALACCEQK